MLDNQEGYTWEDIASPLTKVRNLASLGLNCGGPKPEGGLMKLLCPAIYIAQQQMELTLVEVDIHDQAIFVNDYLLFFVPPPGGKRPLVLPKLKSLSVTVHAGKTDPIEDFTADKLALDELRVNAVDVCKLRAFSVILATLKSAKRVYWNETRCAQFDAGARFTEMNGVRDLTVSVHSQIFESMARRAPNEYIFPDLEHIRLRIHYAFLRHFDVDKMAKLFPGMRVTVSLVDSDYFSMTKTTYIPPQVEGSNEEKTVGFVDMQTLLKSYQLQASPGCTWSSKAVPGDPELGKQCSNLIISTDLWKHGEKGCDNVQKHRGALFFDEFVPLLKAMAYNSLRRVVVPADLVYGAEKPAGIRATSVQELVIQSDVSALGWPLPEPAQLSVNLLNFLQTFPQLHTLTIEPNFLIDWSLVGQLPCKSLTTLVIATGSTGRKPSSLTHILGLLSSLEKLRVLVLRLAGQVNLAEAVKANFQTSLQYLCIHGDEFVDMHEDGMRSMYKKIPRLHCLFVYNKKTGRIYCQREADEKNVRKNECKPARFLHHGVSSWPEYYDVFWRHLITLLGDFTMTLKTRANPFYR